MKLTALQQNSVTATKGGDLKLRSRIPDLIKVYAPDAPVSELAESLGISAPSLYRLLANRESAPSEKTMVALCNYFQCSPGDLFELVRMPA